MSNIYHTYVWSNRLNALVLRRWCSFNHLLLLLFLVKSFEKHYWNWEQPWKTSLLFISVSQELSFDIDYVTGFKKAYLYLSMSIFNVKMTSKLSACWRGTKEATVPTTSTKINTIHMYNMCARPSGMTWPHLCRRISSGLWVKTLIALLNCYF